MNQARAQRWRIDVTETAAPDVDDASRPGLRECLGYSTFGEQPPIPVRIRTVEEGAPHAQFSAWLRSEAQLRSQIRKAPVTQMVAFVDDQLAIERAHGARLSDLGVVSVDLALAIAADVALVAHAFSDVARALMIANVPLLPTREDIVITAEGPIVTSAPYHWMLRRRLAMSGAVRPWETMCPAAAFGTTTKPLVEDAWCLGALLYRLLMGTQIFEPTESELEMFERIRTGVFLPPRALEPSIPGRVDALVVRLLATNGTSAFESFDDMHAEIAGCRDLFPEVTREDVGRLASP